MAAAYVQPSRRPTDGRTAKTPTVYSTTISFRWSLSHAGQYSGAVPRFSERAGHGPAIHDIRFVEDNWENPTLGAWDWAGKCG